ncbi:hypothetical protein APY04_2803 [Hyphomicrobium sulfonivorans]|uniref:Uncharacterized protein n=1 Tax=Hyphomicrobium sulfonivorans TaxID=121290 RepID=A0A109BB07_HYPSL|nr:hypothetical protein APY04_2803 [Hyphomicrobium sulfonivorans]
MSLPIAVHVASKGVHNFDGSVSIPITFALLSELKSLHDDPDTAIQALLMR